MKCVDAWFVCISADIGLEADRVEADIAWTKIHKTNTTMNPKSRNMSESMPVDEHTTM